MVAWCLHRTLALLTAPEFATAASALNEHGAGPRPKVAKAGALDAKSLALSWTQLQRKIMVSMLINSRFWGKESRTVLNSLKPAHATTIGTELTPEQWRCLFERVKAQGMASILPVGSEADDPGFLESRTRHDGIPGLPPLPLGGILSPRQR
eukprot:SRR837773.9803.p3 GENE.SRR837773.9803~~SRR837773.9803.p3  ORF type:complete len:152 (-),score=39.13 SRR837773.9803:80-535(-)